MGQNNESVANAAGTSGATPSGAPLGSPAPVGPTAAAQFVAADPTDNIANRKRMIIQLYHLPSSRRVKFKSFLTQYSDQFESEWKKEAVYGRMDHMQTFEGTTRTISLAWAVPAYDFKEAKENLKKASLLMSMLYPSYAAHKGAGAISAAPLFRLKFVNLIAQPGSLGEGDDVKTSGLVGTVGGFTYEPDIDQGFYVPEDKSGILYPQTINLACEFTVMHTHELGWKAGSLRLKGGARGGYPYNEKFPVDSTGNQRTSEQSPGTEAAQSAAAAVMTTPTGE